ncbi:MAG: hypothetical protein ACTSWY_00160, partial [Promethearchaeota archaeon]
MRILMVVTDIFFPHLSGGARRTLETARILSKMGHNILIFSNKDKNHENFEKIEKYSVYRKRMIEPGVILRGFVGLL